MTSSATVATTPAAHAASSARLRPAQPPRIEHEHERDERPDEVVVPRERARDQHDEQRRADLEWDDRTVAAHSPQEVAQCGEQEPRNVTRTAEGRLGVETRDRAGDAGEPADDGLVRDIQAPAGCVREHVAEPHPRIERSTDRRREDRHPRGRAERIPEDLLAPPYDEIHDDQCGRDLQDRRASEREPDHGPPLASAAATASATHSMTSSFA